MQERTKRTVTDQWARLPAAVRENEPALIPRKSRETAEIEPNRPDNWDKHFLRSVMAVLDHATDDLQRAHWKNHIFLVLAGNVWYVETANWSLRQGDEEVNKRIKQKNIH